MSKEHLGGKNPVRPVPPHLDRESPFHKAWEEFMSLHPRTESVVRLDQEAAIVADLGTGTPVLVRGNWRIGKTSMILTVAKAHFQDESAMYIDVGHYAGSKSESSPEGFRKLFGIDHVRDLIVDKENVDQGSPSYYDRPRREEVKKDIIDSDKGAFEYLNDYLNARGEHAVVGIDEVIGYSGRPEMLQHIADISKFPSIRLMVVLHRFHEHEPMFRSLFESFDSQYIRTLALEETARLVRHGLRETPIKFTDGAVEAVHEFTGGRPMEINNLCAAMFDPFRVSDYAIHRDVYEAKDILKFTEEDFWKTREVFQVATHTYERVFRHAMSAQERALISGLLKGENFLDGDVSSLAEVNAVRKDPNTGRWHINGRLFQRIMEEQIEIDKVAKKCI